MAFLRTLSSADVSKFAISATVLPDIELHFTPCGNYIKLRSDDNDALVTLLKTDVAAGNVFPAVRNNELHFYYKGGCLFKFKSGAFYRNKNFSIYSAGTNGLSTYEKLKKENENRFKGENGEDERQLLDKLYRYTYNRNSKSNVVVLDIEVNINGLIGKGKKCDLVLFNTVTREIMFVEGKVFSDNRVKTEVGRPIEVIEQVNVYTAAIAEQKDNIIEQYGNYIRIINEIFGMEFQPPKRLIEPAKLLVYETSGGTTANATYSINTINQKLGASNVMWVSCGNYPTLDEIWNALTQNNLCK